jgi:2-oxoglutarate ferredoxin oxidoreductase subunit delta
LKGKIRVIEDACKGCGLCIESCPFDLIRLSERINAFGYKSVEQIDPEGKCTACKMCALICPDVAIEVFKLEKDEKDAA